MRLTLTAAALAALISSVLAQTANFDPITEPTKDEEVPAGEVFNIEWQPSTSFKGGVTINLLGGKTPSTLVDLGSIGTADNADGTFAWDVDSTLGKDETYGIKISLDSDPTIFQFSFPFHITPVEGGAGGNGTSSSASASETVTVESTSTDMSSYPTTTPAGNYSTSAYPTKTTLTSTVGGHGSTSTGGSGSSTATGAAGTMAAAPLALLGGLAMAAFAL